MSPPLPQNDFDADNIARSVMDGSYFAKPENSRAQVLRQAGKELDVDPADLGGIIDFESGQNPHKVGGEGGRYKGLIQFGPDEQKKYYRPGDTFESQVLNGVVPYFKDRFKQAGRSTSGATLEDLYTAVIAGNPNANRDKTDSFGTSARSGAAKIAREHRPKILRDIFGGEEPSFDPEAVAKSFLDNSAPDTFNPDNIAASVMDGSYFNDGPDKAPESATAGIDPSKLFGGNVKVSPKIPVPEHPDTLSAQRQAAHDPQSSRIGVLYTPGATVPDKSDDEVDIPITGGQILRVNGDKFHQYVQSTGITPANLSSGKADFTPILGGKAEPTGEMVGTQSQYAVVSTDKDGRELVASGISDPRSIPTEAALQKQQFPNQDIQTSVVPGDEVVNHRLGTGPQDVPGYAEQVIPPDAMPDDNYPYKTLGQVAPKQDDAAIEAQKENERQTKISRQRTQAIQQSLKPQSQAAGQYDFQKSGELVLPATMGETAPQKLTYKKDANLEKNGEYRLSDDEGNDYIYSPTTGKIVDEADTQVLKTVDVPLPDKDTMNVGTVKRLQGAAIADAVAEIKPDIPKQDIIDFFSQYGLSHTEGDKAGTDFDVSDYFHNPLDPTSGKTTSYNLTQRGLNQLEAFSKQQEDKRQAFKTAKEQYASDDDYISTVKAQRDAKMISSADADELLASYDENKERVRDQLSDQKLQDALEKDSPDSFPGSNILAKGIVKLTGDEVPVSDEEVATEMARQQAEAAKPENQRIQSVARAMAKSVEPYGKAGKAFAGFFGGAGGNLLTQAAGAVRPFSSIPGFSDAYKYLSETGQEGQIASELSKGKTLGDKATHFIADALGNTVVLIGESRLPYMSKSPVLFAINNMLGTAGAGKSLNEIYKAGEEGLVMGKVLDGGTSLGRIVKGVVGKSAMPEAVQDVWKALSTDTRNKLVDLAKTGTSPDKRSLMLSTVAGLGSEVAIIGPGSIATAKAFGKTNDEALDVAATNLLYHTAMGYGPKLADGLQKMAGGVYRVWKGGKFADYTVKVDADGKGHVTTDLDNIKPGMVDMEVVADPGFQKYAAKDAKIQSDVKAQHITDASNSLQNDTVDTGEYIAEAPKPKVSKADTEKAIKESSAEPKVGDSVTYNGIDGVITGEQKDKYGESWVVDSANGKDKVWPKDKVKLEKPENLNTSAEPVKETQKGEQVEFQVVEKPDVPAKVGENVPDVKRSSVGDFTAKGGNKVVDDKGEPLTVYHGSVAGEQPTFTEKGRYGGIYFSADPAYASKFADSSGTVGKYHVNLQNPYRMDAQATRGEIYENDEHWGNYRYLNLRENGRQKLIDAGYDGIIVKFSGNKEHGPNDHFEVVAFHPEQVKSAISNTSSPKPEVKEVIKPVKVEESDGELKEPWQMTKGEWDALPSKEQDATHGKYGQGANPSHSNYHVIRVLSALNHGEEVPRANLDDLAETGSYHAGKILEDATLGKPFPKSTMDWVNDTLSPSEHARIIKDAVKKRDERIALGLDPVTAIKSEAPAKESVKTVIKPKAEPLSVPKEYGSRNETYTRDKAEAAKLADKVAQEVGDWVKPHIAELYPAMAKRGEGAESPKVETESGEPKGKSKIGISIERKAMDRGFDSFEDTADFDKKKIADQSERIHKIVSTDVERAKNIALGNEPVPEGLSPQLFHTALENIAEDTGDIELSRQLAKAPIVSDSSVHAQEMRFMQERRPDSLAAKIQEVRRARIAGIKKLLNGRTVDQAIHDETVKIGKQLNTARKAPIEKKDWNDWLDKLEC